MVHGIDKKSVLPVHDLASDAADIPPEHDSTLPHRFGNGQTKPFANRFLQHNGGPALQCVDQGGIVYGQDNNSLVDGVTDRFENDIGFRIVDRTVAKQNKRAIAASDGVTNAATIPAAIRSFILILSSWILESDARLPGWVIRPTELGSLRRVLSALSGSGTIVVRHGTKLEMP